MWLIAYLLEANRLEISLLTSAKQDHRPENGKVKKGQQYIIWKLRFNQYMRAWKLIYQLENAGFYLQFQIINHELILAKENGYLFTGGSSASFMGPLSILRGLHLDWQIKLAVRTAH